MNRSIVYLVLGILCSLFVVGSFFGDTSSSELFGQSVNIWVYRLFWGAIAIVQLFAFKASKKK